MHWQRDELASRGRTRIVEGECRRLERLLPPDVSFDADEFIRIKGARELPGIERQILRELYILRERLAVEFGRPPFKVVGNDSMVAIAVAKPKTLFQLGRIGGISHGQARRLGKEVLEAIDRAIELGPLTKLPRLPNREGTSGFSEEDLELHERLKVWRKNEASRMGIDSAYLVNRHVLLRIVQARPRTVDALSRVEGIEPWQTEELGKELVGVVQDFEKDLAAGRIPVRRRSRSSRAD
jgi:ribonuclease D